ncbi:MAG: replicative DNA helicase [Proteobacteria bacterium]|nr:replicative DNA helicase [Pseudomonadota bacterium]
MTTVKANVTALSGALPGAPSAKEKEYKEPYNTEAEQMVLGAILVDNEAIFKISDFLNADHFYEPVHGRIFAAIQRFMERGLTANPVTLKNQFDGDEALKDIGGAGYLVKITGLATGVVHVKDYAQTIYELAIARSLIRLGNEMVEDMYDTKLEEPPSKIVEQIEQKLFKIASDGSSDKNFAHLKSALAESLRRIEQAYKQKDEVTGITTGYRDMDRMLGGFQNSDLVILAGRPSMGKTALAINFAMNAAKHYQEKYAKQEDKTEPCPSVGVFSLEMSSEQLASRLLSMETGIGSNDIRRGRLDDKSGEFEKLVAANRDLYDLPMYIDDTPALSIAAIRTRARRLKRKHNLSLLVIDYLQLLRGVSKVSESSRVQEVSEITMGLKAIAKELDIPVLALSQLSRQVESRDDKRPQLADLRESGSIEQDADIVMFIFREQYYLERTKPADGSPELDEWTQKNGERWMQCRNKAEVIISKHRNGPIGNVQLMFNGATTSFKDLEQDYQYSGEAPF